VATGSEGPLPLLRKVTLGFSPALPITRPALPTVVRATSSNGLFQSPHLKPQLLHNDKENNAPRGHSTSYHAWTYQQTSKYMGQKMTDLQGEIDASTIMIVIFNTPVSEMNSGRQKWPRMNLNSTSPIHQLEAINIHGLLQFNTAELMFFSRSRGTFIMTDHNRPIEWARDYLVYTLK
jgi:hypothetical protein